MTYSVLTVLASVIIAAAIPSSAGAAIDDAVISKDRYAELRSVEVRLEENPDNPALRFRRARLLRNIGETDAALLELDGLRSDFPDDVDYALAHARILSQIGRDDEALRELSAAADLAPDYENVWQLRFALLLRQQNEAPRFDLEALRQEAASRFPDASWWRAPVVDDHLSWTLLVGAGQDELSNGLAGWNNQFIEVHREHGAQKRVFFRLGRDQRYSEADSSFGLGGEYSWGRDWSGGADLAVAENAVFLADFAYGAHIGKSLTGGLVFDLRYRRREYAATSVGSVIGTVEKYAGNFRVAYETGLSHLAGESNFMNQVLAFNWFYSERASVGVTVNTGEEVESIGNGQVLKTDVDGVSLNGRHPLTERFGLRWWMGLHDQGDFYRRRYLGMAVSIRF